MRINHVNITIGKRGCGKTTKTINLIEKSNLKTLVVDTFDHENYRKFRAIQPVMINDKIWKAGNVRCYGHDFKDIFYQISNKISNAMIVLEDCTKYLKHPLNQDALRFIVDSKQKNIDLVFMFHGFGMVMPDLFRLADSLTIFKTNENIDTYRNKIPNFDSVKKEFTAIQNSQNKYIHKTIRIN
ncbi:MAG TPA: hypothetical protein PLR84_10905 [Chitinophagales bacterium]|nr:hypothetical protein [Chitinophagales bacterium]